MIPQINYGNYGIQTSKRNNLELKDVVIGGVVLIGSVWAVRQLGDMLKPVPEKKTLRYTADALEDLNKNPSTAQTIPDAMAYQFADQLFTALDGYQSDEETVYRIFRKLKKNADYLAVSKAFGYREISSGTWNPEKNFKGNLAGALTSELDETELAKVNKIMANNKLKYRL